MTMRIVIENTDASRTVVAQLRAIPQPGGHGRVPSGQKPIEIAPGAKADIWLHSGQDCVLSEV